MIGVVLSKRLQRRWVFANTKLLYNDVAAPALVCCWRVLAQPFAPCCAKQASPRALLAVGTRTLLGLPGVIIVDISLSLSLSTPPVAFQLSIFPK